MITGLVAFFGKFFVQIFSNIVTDMLSTPAETTTIKRYAGKTKMYVSNTARLATKYARLRDGGS